MLGLRIIILLNTIPCSSAKGSMTAILIIIIVITTIIVIVIGDLSNHSISYNFLNKSNIANKHFIGWSGQANASFLLSFHDK